MKKFLISTAVLALTVSASLAADLPSRKGPPVLPPPPPPPPLWTGFYAGLNAGYNFGTNSNAQSVVYGQDAVGFGGLILSRDRDIAALSDVQTISDLPTTALLQRSFFQIAPYNVGFPTGIGLAQSGSFSNTQSGFIGGGQIGYNYQWGQHVVIGIEADLQGTGIRGTSFGGGAVGGSNSSPLIVCDVTGALLAGCNGINTRLGNPKVVNSANSVGATTVNAGVDWLGTIRGRLGWLWTPTMLLYATGGLTYGGVYARVNQWGTTNLEVGLANNQGATPTIGTNHTFIGGGNKSQTLVGWNVGGGIEWMFMPNWSIKAEGIYWNMGNMNVPTASFAAAPITGIGGPVLGGLSAFNGLSTFGVTRVNYQGVIARAGVNYHFNWGGAAPVMASY
jgi:outer membrane immunogenic protein